jgi:hypothetical protein
MTIKIRRLIFYSLIAIFIVLAFIIIPYSYGWVFDLKTFTFTQVGGLYLEINPSDADIAVNGLKMQIKPGFLKSGILVANLFPKTYHVTVAKQNYQEWNDDVAVKPSLVTQIHPIVLLPQKIQMEAVAKNVKDVFINSDKVAWKDIGSNLKINGKNIRGNQFVCWLNNNKFIVTLDKSTNNYFAVNINDSTALNINLIFKNLKDQQLITDSSKINKIIPYPSDDNKIILSSDRALYVLDLSKSSISTMKKGKYNLLVAGDGKTYFGDDQGFYSYDLSAKTVSFIASTSPNFVEISPNGQFLAFSGNNKLFLLDKNDPNKKITELSDNPSYFKFSPDSKKIAEFSANNQQINIYYIGDDYDLFGKKPMGHSTFHIGNLDSASPISWHNNSSYIFLKYTDNVKLLEINDKNPPANIQLIESGVDKYFYNQETNTIYLLIDGVLYKTYL